MVYKLLPPRKALNKAYLKVKPTRNEIESFKANLIELLDQINEKESEEFHKNTISKFLDKTYYGGHYYINTKGRNDLVIHTDKTAKSSVGVIVETKKPTNKGEMVQKDNLNTKAFQELVLYYMRERIGENNLEIKHLIITNIYEWFIFDVDIFEKAFAQNKEFEKKFIDFEEKRLSGKNTDFFYKEIAEPAVEELLAGKTKAGKELSYTHFDLRPYEKIVRNNDKQDDNKLIALFKLLSPEHLLKLPFRNDSNSLDKTFYSELLHIIGLTEVKDGGKKLIDRKSPSERNIGSLLENTITQLESLDKLSRLDKPAQFGGSVEERYFNVGLELTITWINRLLFLKLLEAQLVSYNKGDRSYAFLKKEKIKGFDDLNSLFFQVLAKEIKDRSIGVNEAFSKIPYLNSSLFEPSDLEQICFPISQLQDNILIPILSNTVLKDANGKKRSGKLNALEYLFNFLDSYDFSGEGSEDIQEENKSLISASVLGLIFEKINGYKDGSFFTPGFITMYMCGETIRKSVIEKFNEVKGWNCKSFEEVYDKIEDKVAANNIINSLKLVDPAVGSGHFLVSALNEIIAIKSDLRILLDRHGKSLRDYHIEISNDELTITDEDGKLFEYNPKNKESQRVQEAIFHEKQQIIENCLFGVDINTNSVKICRLRLWIELLKNAYYKADDELETLPNIDINIKCGNSLISRYSLESDLSQALKKSKITIKKYREAVQRYRHAASKDQKREMESLIATIKGDFKTEISNNDPKIKRLRSKKGDLEKIMTQHSLFELSKTEQKEKKKIQANLEKEIEKLSNEVEEIRNNKIFENAFEWRFEFPEVLDDEGNYLGFDIVIGNPPYIRIQELNQANVSVVDYYNNAYLSTGSGNYDLYIPFIELGYHLLRTNGNFCYIMPHKFTNANYGEKVREFISERFFLSRLILFGALQVFEDATTYTGLFFMSKKKNEEIEFLDCDDFKLLDSKKQLRFSKLPAYGISKEEWIFLSSEDSDLLSRLKSRFPTLESNTQRIFQGLKTSSDKIYILEKVSETDEDFEVLCKQNEKKYRLEKDLLFPLIKGGNSRAFQITETELLVLFPYSKGLLIEESVLKKKYPKTYSYLEEHKSSLEKREDGKMIGKGWYQFGRNQAIDVITLPKLFTPDIAPAPRFSYDSKGEYFFTGGVSGGYGVVPKTGISPYYLLAILNSPVAEWYINKTSTQMRGGWFSFESRYIKNLPVPEQPIEIEIIENKVKEIIDLKYQNLAADKLELELNSIVAKLYQLSDEDTKTLSLGRTNQGSKDKTESSALSASL
ncbi:MAG: Eco57I restriction-modification methylase domain-containing protein [Chitinophagaceae bacterium]